ncbi:MAG: hypothetical protein LBC86_10280, partial [Oscillospiraceae bacterium]|nr:hypothetical protein [Oscillospiraceae bacterium]
MKVRTKRKILSFFITLAMIVGMMPALPASATGEPVFLNPEATNDGRRIQLENIGGLSYINDVFGFEVLVEPEDAGNYQVGFAINGLNSGGSGSGGFKDVRADAGFDLTPAPDQYGGFQRNTAGHFTDGTLKVLNDAPLYDPDFYDAGGWKQFTINNTGQEQYSFTTDITVIAMWFLDENGDRLGAPFFGTEPSEDAVCPKCIYSLGATTVVGGWDVAQNGWEVPASVVQSADNFVLVANRAAITAANSDGMGGFQFVLNYDGWDATTIIDGFATNGQLAAGTGGGLHEDVSVEVAAETIIFTFPTDELDGIDDISGDGNFMIQFNPIAGFINEAYFIIENCDCEPPTGKWEATHLDVDFNDASVYGTIVPTELLANTPWQKHPSGWYLRGGGRGSTSDFSLIATPDGTDSSVAGANTLSLGAMSSNANRAGSIDLIEPIEPNTGLDGMSFDFAWTSAGQSQTATMWFSDGSSGPALAERAVIDANDRVDDTVRASILTTDGHLTISNNTGTPESRRARALTGGTVRVDPVYTTIGPVGDNTNDVWHTIHAVIDTDTDTITWYVGAAGENVTFEDVANGTQIANVIDNGLLTWGEGNEIRSLSFATGSNASVRLLLANIQVSSFSAFDCEVCEDEGAIAGVCCTAVNNWGIFCPAGAANHEIDDDDCIHCLITGCAFNAAATPSALAFAQTCSNPPGFCDGCTDRCFEDGGHDFGDDCPNVTADCETCGAENDNVECGDCTVCLCSTSSDHNSTASSLATVSSLATCTEYGFEKWNCEECGFETAAPATVSSLPPLGHDEDGDPATCEDDQICARDGCNEVLVEALGHSNLGPAATCTTAQICARVGCDHVIAPPLNHILTPGLACNLPNVCGRNDCDEPRTGAPIHVAGPPATCTTPQVCVREGCLVPGHIITEAGEENCLICEDCECLDPNVIFDMQTYDPTDLMNLDGRGRLTPPLFLTESLPSDNGAGVIMNVTTTPRTLSVIGSFRTGSSQGLRLGLGTFNNMTEEGLRYTLVYGGIITAVNDAAINDTSANFGRLRLESATNPSAANPGGLGTGMDGALRYAIDGVLSYGELSETGAFTATYTATAEMFAAKGNAGTISFADHRQDGSRHYTVLYNNVKILEDCGECENCAPELPPSAVPAVAVSTVAKTAATQPSVNFTLTTAIAGDWKVYTTAEGAVLAGVTAAASGTTLTLTHATDIPAATYYVTVTEA